MNIKDLLKDAYKEGMSLEEIETALKDIDLPTDNSAEIDRLKAALSKSNSEAADFKKQLREKMSAEEVKAKEDADKIEELIKERDALLREKTVAGHKAQYLALGYDEGLANATAEALANGEIDKVFANQKKHLESVEKKIRADVLKDTPKPEGGNGSETMTKEKFLKMPIAEQHKYSVEHPEEYKKLYGGN
jgi:flagellar biosynthesis/type III secretory pathway protein FliH